MRLWVGLQTNSSKEFNVFLNNVIFSEFRQDRREGNRTEVLVNVINRPLFRHRDNVSLFPRRRKAGFVERGVEDRRDWTRQEISVFL